ncbi:MAG: hypothetical protein ACYC4U_15995 [Pirellulaceae bacterium]
MSEIVATNRKEDEMARGSKRRKAVPNVDSTCQSTHRVGPEITVVGPEGPPSDELLERLADLLLDIADEQQGDGLGTKPPKA